VTGNNPRLSIIIANWNTRDLLANCLSSVYQNPPSATFDIWVVDNASTDASPTMVREQFPFVNLIENKENRGFAAANNQGIYLSHGDLVLFLNSDTSVQSDSLQAMIDFMEKHPQAGGMAGMLLNPDGSFQTSYATFPSLWSEFLLVTRLSRVLIGPYAPSPRPKKNEEAHPVDWVAGATLIVRRSVLNQAGSFDENYFFYSEDTDLCWRIWKSGWQIWYDPHIKVYHLGGGSSRNSSLQSYIHLYENKIKFMNKNYGNSKARNFRLLLRILVTLRLGIWKLFKILPLSGWKDIEIIKRIEQEKALLLTL
jgi:hypothetical protein